MPRPNDTRRKVVRSRTEGIGEFSQRRFSAVGLGSHEGQTEHLIALESAVVERRIFTTVRMEPRRIEGRPQIFGFLCPGARVVSLESFRERRDLLRHAYEAVR